MPKTKKERLEEILFTDEYFEDRKKRKKKQEREEKLYKYGMISFIIILNTILLLPQLLSPDAAKFMFSNFAIYNFSSENFKIWQPITSIFMHGGILHLAINMFVLWSFGKSLISIWGNHKFLYIYMLSGIAGALAFGLFTPIGIPGVGASGALCGILGAFALMFPDAKVLLFFVIPVKAAPLVKWFGIISFALMMINLIGINFLGGIGHSAHLFGLLAGFGIAYNWKKKGNLMM